MGRHSAERRSPLPALLSVVAVLAIAGAAFLVFRVLSGSSTQAAPLPAGVSSTSSATTSTTPSTTPSSSTSTPSTTATASTPASPPLSAADAAATTALQGCVTLQAAEKPVVDAAYGGAEHWSEHVQGQTDIESGAKTYIDVKTNVFGPSRAAGPGDIAAYDSAQAALKSVTATCADPGSGSPSAALATKLKDCTTRQQLTATYLGTAAAVMNDWRTHLQEMADHSDGHLNGPDAQARWIERWKAAPTHLNPYNAANAALAQAPACSL